VWKPTKKL